MKVVLTTLHAKYIHASLALPCLKAATDDIKGIRSVIREYTVNEPRTDVLRRLVAEDADVVAFSCYIWNIEAVSRLASDLKKLRPTTIVVAGGPEVSYSAVQFLKDNGAFDCVICGEGEQPWRELLMLLAGSGVPALPNHAMPAGIAYRNESTIVDARERATMANLDDIPSPFALELVDTSKPLVYYETSRGCPFSCAFCLSSLEKGVRSFSMNRIRADILHLIRKEVRVVKLVDRTFNYDAGRANEIWDFILAHNKTSTFHFEIAGDLLNEGNFQTLAKVPEGMFRFEIGVQATGEETLSRVGRKSDTHRLLAKVKRLREETGVTIHLDLVAGLPGEDFAGFLSSLECLFAVNPHHIQVEPLKVLKGSPMEEIARREGYAFSDTPPYTILRTPDLSFEKVGRIEEISRLLDKYYNSGRFARSLALVMKTIPLAAFFDRMACFLEKKPETGHVSLKGLFELMERFAGEVLPVDILEIFRDALRYDFCFGEYPTAGSMPAFFPVEWKSSRCTVAGNLLEPILANVEKPTGSRVRTFTARFLNDYRSRPPKPGTVTLVFVYVSAPGRGLKVEVFALPATTT